MIFAIIFATLTRVLKKNLILFLLLFVCATLNAQIVTVRDAESGDPMMMVTIASNNPKAHTTTNMNGQTDISVFKGADTIQIRMLGYEILNMSYAEISASNFKVELKREGLSLGGFTLTANRWVQPKLDVPGKVSTIGSREITFQNPQTAADVLANSGEVFIQKSQGGGGSPMIRGFATNRLLITVDGVRMNTAIFRGGNVQNIISIDPFSIGAAEIFFGPGSVMYGSDAIGGVMGFQTLTPLLALDSATYINGSASTRYSSANNELTGHFDISLGWKKWAFTTSATYFHYDDLKMGSNGPDDYLRTWYVSEFESGDLIKENTDPEVQVPTGYDQFNVLQKIRFKPSRNFDFTYSFIYSETSHYPRYDRLVRTKNGLPRSGEWSYGPQKWMMNVLNITHLGDSSLYDELSIRLAHQFFEESRIDRDYQDVMRNTRIEQVQAYSLNIDFNKRYDSRKHLFYGAEVVFNDVTSTGEFKDIFSGSVSPAPSRYPQSVWASYGAYVTYQLKATEKIILQSGARYNYFTIDAEFDTTFFPLPFSSATLNSGALTGSLGMVINPNEQWSIGINASTGFRSPNVDDMGKIFDSEPGAVVVPNPDLKAEYAYNAELDIAKLLGENVKIDAIAYYTILNNALVRRNYILNGQDSIMYNGEMSQVQAVQNAAKAVVYGIQAGIDFEFVKGFKIESKLSYQIGEEELDDGTISPSRHAAPMFGSTHFVYSSNKLKLDLYAIYVAERPFSEMPVGEIGKDYLYALNSDGNPYAPSWYTLNFKSMYKPNAFLTITTGVENITDQRYRPYSSGIAAPGRNFIISLRASF